MVALTVAYVEGGAGHLQTLILSLEEATGEPRVGFQNMQVTTAVAEQLSSARAAASFFLRQPYVKPIAAQTLEKGTMLVRPAEQAISEAVVYDERSFGLAFLAGCLALGLDAPLRPGRVLTARLDNARNVSGVPGGLLQLGPVTGLEAKLSAASRERKESLLYNDDEHALLRFEQAYWRGDEPQACFPRLVPRSISIAAAAASSLDLRDLLRRCSESPDNSLSPFAFVLLYAAGQLSDGLAHTEGIGHAFAQLRARGALGDRQQFQTLTEALGFSGLAEGEDLIRFLLPPALSTCTSDEMSADLVLAAICEEPFIADRYLDDEGLPSSKWLGAFEKWLGNPAPSNLWQLSFVLTIIQTAIRLIADFDTYDRRCCSLVLHGLRGQLERAAECARKGGVPEAVKQIEQLHDAAIGQRLLRINPDWGGEAASIVSNWASQVKSFGSRDLAQAAAALNASFDACTPLSTVESLRERVSQAMRLTFRIAQPSELERISTAFRPPLKVVNDLALRVTGPTSLDVTIPSPVVLFENSLSEPPFSWRSGAVLADDTFGRYPLADALVIRHLFAAPVPGNFICFEYGKGDKDIPAGVLWNSIANPWPPAIDSQLLVASMARWGSQRQPRRVLDVGTGTGYLAVAAAHVWPSTEELHLLEVDAGALKAAVLNVQYDARGATTHVLASLCPFQRFTETGFDVVVCCPPYLPNRPLPVSRIEMATNNTALLEDLVRRGASITNELWLAFSSIAWQEFCGALVASRNTWERVEVLERNVVPFRITWLFPRPDEPRDISDQKVHYFIKTLAPRGVIDLNNPPASWPEFLERHAPDVPEAAIKERQDYTDVRTLEERLRRIQDDARGFRFWHEVRVVRLTSATKSAPSSRHHQITDGDLSC